MAAQPQPEVATTADIVSAVLAGLTEEVVDQSRLLDYSEVTARAVLRRAYATATGPANRIAAAKAAVVDYINRTVILVTKGRDVECATITWFEDDESAARPVCSLNPARTFVEASGIVGDFPELEQGFAEIRGDNLPAGAPRPTQKQIEKSIAAHVNSITNLKIGDIWFKSTSRRRAAGVAFLPPPVDPTASKFYNIYGGPAISREAAGNPEGPGAVAWRKHVLRITRGDKLAAAWLENWCAGLIQRPGEKVRTAVILKGEKGTGKGAFVESLRAIIGEEYCRQASTKNKIVGNFNSMIENAILVFLDEISWAGVHEEAETLKKLITEKTMEIEKKHKDAYKIQNRAHYIIATNNDWAVPTSEDERRYSVFNVSDELRGPDGKGSIVRNDMINGAKDIAAYLYNLPYDVKAANILYETEELHEQQTQSLDGIREWWFNCLQEGELDGAEEPQRSSFFSEDIVARNKIPRDAIYKAYLETRRTKKYGSTDSRIKVFTELYRLSPSMSLFNDKLKKKVVDVMNEDGTFTKEKKNACVMPTLAEAIADYRAVTNFRGKIGDDIYTPPAPAAAAAAAAVDDSGAESAAESDKADTVITKDEIAEAMSTLDMMPVEIEGKIVIEFGKEIVYTNPIDKIEICELLDCGKCRDCATEIENQRVFDLKYEAAQQLIAATHAPEAPGKKHKTKRAVAAVEISWEDAMA